MKRIFKYLIAAIGFCATVSCEDMNSLHQEYLDRGELIYPGKVDSINIYPGIEKVKFEWEVKADPRISKVEIHWSEGVEAKKREYPVIRTEDGSFIMSALIDSIPEGSYNFEFITWDDAGNRSLASTRAVDIYGNSGYLAHRLAKTTRLGNGTLIAWQPADSSMVRVELSYTDLDGLQQQTTVLPEEKNTIVLHQGEIQMVTVYKKPLDLDTLRATAKTLPVSTSLAKTIVKEGTSIITAVDFDLGGEGVAYHDSDSSNEGNNDYRGALGEENCPVDIQNTPPNVGWSNAGEWLQYTVTVEEEGDYLADLNLSVGGGSAQYSLIVNGVKTDVYNLISNSNWDSYRWYHQTNPAEPQPEIHLLKGVNVIRLYMDNGGFNLRSISLINALYVIVSPDNRVSSLAPALYYGFTNATDLSLPFAGSAPLEFSEQVMAKPALNPGDGKKAVQITKTNKVKVQNPVSSPLNRYTLMWDINIPVGGEYYTLLQTSLTNSSDANLFINRNRQLGRGDYSGALVELNEWHRIVLVVDDAASGSTVYKVYLNGQHVLTNNSGSIKNGAVSLKEHFWIFTDEDGEDNELYCAGFAMWANKMLTDTEIAALGKTVL
ncbi:MAG: hypothetical protein LBD59_11705 [Prevotellaceae bacterium]|jgi:hypothetical protein|nr:hypothetical protein [Prevotellaceae bacterium]